MNTKTWRDRFNEKFKLVFVAAFPNSLNLREVVQTDLKNWFAAELLLLAEGLRGEKIKRNDKGCFLKGDDGNVYITRCEHGNCEHYGLNSGLDLAISRLKEAAK